ncbi:hypothetical protein JTB14_007757 [Gonioctena quinquepunctata]|nr:hypothetical protein JTB14_007757 [Gonioctena quinquepunctata]
MRLRAAPRQFTYGDNECLINLITDLVEALEGGCKISDFDNENINDAVCKCLTKSSEAQFETVVDTQSKLIVPTGFKPAHVTKLDVNDRKTADGFLAQHTNRYDRGPFVVVQATRI